MEKSYPFYDFNVFEVCVRTAGAESTINLFYTLGYRTIAINHVVSQFARKKKNQNEVTDIVPVPISIKVAKEYKDMKVLKRLTIEFSTSEYVQQILKSGNIAKYDIIAALPTTKDAFSCVCNTLEADILCFNPEIALEYKFTRKSYNNLLKRGYHIEMIYSPAICDDSLRRNIIHTANTLNTHGHAKGILLCSGACKLENVRGPYDVINLGTIFGLNERQCRDAVNYNGSKVFYNAVARRNKNVFFINDDKNYF